MGWQRLFSNALAGIRQHAVVVRVVAIGLAVANVILQTARAKGDFGDLRELATLAHNHPVTTAILTLVAVVALLAWSGHRARMQSENRAEESRRFALERQQEIEGAYTRVENRTNQLFAIILQQQARSEQIIKAYQRREEIERLIAELERRQTEIEREVAALALRLQDIGGGEPQHPKATAYTVRDIYGMSRKLEEANRALELAGGTPVTVGDREAGDHAAPGVAAIPGEPALVWRKNHLAAERFSTAVRDALQKITNEHQRLGREIRA